MDLLNSLTDKGMDIAQDFIFMKWAIYFLIANAIVTWAYILLSRKVSKDE